MLEVLPSASQINHPPPTRGVLLYWTRIRLRQRATGLQTGRSVAMNRWLLLLLLATRFDCVCISYNASAASGFCPATETSNQENCCANFPTMVGSFNVDADGETKQCDCCCSSCPEDVQSVCIQSTGEDVPKPSATVCSSDDDCAGISLPVIAAATAAMAGRAARCAARSTSSSSAPQRPTPRSPTTGTAPTPARTSRKSRERRTRACWSARVAGCRCARPPCI